MIGKITEIIWSQESINDLQLIFKFYVETATKQVAKKIISELLIKVEVIKLSPFIGQIEPLLQHLPLGIRYLVKGNYKIFYTTFENTAYILFVFDCRQNPDKLNQYFG